MELELADLIGGVIVVLVIATLCMPGSMFWVVRTLGALLLWMDRVNVRVGCLRIYRECGVSVVVMRPVSLRTVGCRWRGVYVTALFWRISITWSYPVKKS